MAKLAEALDNALVAPPPPWERIAKVGFAGAELVYRVSIRVARGIDLACLERAVAPRYRKTGDAYELGGRTIRFEPRVVTLAVRGTRAKPPGDDGGVQSAILLAIADAAAAATPVIEWLETERWTDTPFEEAPAARRTGEEARAWLERIVRSTVAIVVTRIDYFRDSANPRIDLDIDGPTRHEMSVRERWLPAEVFVRPGRYTLRAFANPYSFPSYRPHLAPHARTPLWMSPALTLDAASGETITLRVGAPAERRTLTDDEAAFFAQEAGTLIGPPPVPRENLELERS